MPRKKSGPKPKPEEIEERTIEGMVVKRTGRGFYECSSGSRPGVKHHVDILALGGLGECSCEDFMCRRKPRWKDVNKPYDAFRCRHLRRVRQHVLDQILNPYVQKEKGH